MNRLNLNWNLNLRSERNLFAQEYLQTIQFTPTEDELETISNYILWGKVSGTEKDGPARLKDDGIFLDSKWTGSTQVESLDELVESPTFSENEIQSLGAPVPRKVREVFSREEARAHASPLVLENLEALWLQIDITELTINFYELAHGKRKNPPRQALLDRLSVPDIDTARAKAAKLNQRTYLKQKHLLKDLRDQQFPYQDTYRHTIGPTKSHPYQELGTPSEFGSDISVKPLGLNCGGLIGGLHQKVFNKKRMPAPEDFEEEELDTISNMIWKQEESKKIFDFREVEHLKKLFDMWEELDGNRDESESIKLFMDTADVYIGLAGLDEKERLILDMKIKKKSNQEIQERVFKEFGHKYQLNYISTLYCKKILVKIADAAKRHREVCENLFFPENFKKCKDCGEWLLLDEKNWMKRKRSNDGFSPRCKKCEKKKRLGLA